MTELKFQTKLLQMSLRNLNKSIYMRQETIYQDTSSNSEESPTSPYTTGDLVRETDPGTQQWYQYLLMVHPSVRQLR